VPAINLFEVEAEPIHVDHRQQAYRVIPVLHDGNHVETFSVDSVQAFDHHSGQRHDYLPFAAFATVAACCDTKPRNATTTPIRARAPVVITIAG
jgi:type VI protein secretion system component VasA